VVNGAAYAHCQRLARQHYENFPVASRLLPAAMRPHIAAVYAFARIADDFADEGARSDAARLALLDEWERKLDVAVRGETPDDGSDSAAIFTALGDTIRTCRLDTERLRDLLNAFRQDVTVKRYETWDDVLDYCRRSANPVGRLVLQIAGYRDVALDAASDALCTALQLTNFWQDLERDWTRGRLYVPAVVVRLAGADERDLDRKQLTSEWRSALADVSARTRALFAAGRPVADGVGGRLRWELRTTWLAGVRILDRLEAAGFDVFRARPAIESADAWPLAWRLVTWRRQP
jgi:phytoene synthase